MTEETKKQLLHFPFMHILRFHVNGGMLLMVTALAAIFIANSPWSEAYQNLWTHEIRLQIGDFNLFNHGGHPLTLMGFINDVLMAVFFFAVGLEIKREILVGELSSFKQAMLPIIAACGGMIMPVVIYYLITRDTPAVDGLAIPMATDIAFSLGVLSLFGKRVPLSLKIFLTAFAVVDDIGGILVIALFYSSHCDVNYLMYALLILGILLIGNQMRVSSSSFYLVLGIGIWYCFMQSGVHATIAGVIVAFTVPARPKLRIGKYINRMHDLIVDFPPEPEKIILGKEQICALKTIEADTRQVVSPLQFMEDALHWMVNYLIMPLFAFANAGVVLTASHGGLELGLPTFAIILGLVVGKFVGIYLFSWGTLKLKLADMPNGMTWKNLSGICLLGGIGFTVSLFIANLSFGEEPHLLNQAKMGVVAGTVLAGILGYIVLHFTLPKKAVEK